MAGFLWPGATRQRVSFPCKIFDETLSSSSSLPHHRAFFSCAPRHSSAHPPVNECENLLARCVKPHRLGPAGGRVEAEIIDDVPWQ